MLRNTNLEIKAGILLMAGIGLACVIVLILGERPDLLEPTYNFTIVFPDASGVLKGSDVFLSGELIGKVTTNPKIVAQTQMAEVKVKINRSVGIRQDARYVIESSGFLGDAFIEVVPKVHRPGRVNLPYVEDGDIVRGIRAPDLSTLYAASLPLIHRANHVAAQVDHIVTGLNTDVLTDETVGNLKDINGELKDTAERCNDLVANANDLITGIKSGNGVLGELLYDKEVRGDVAAFTSNLKLHGLLFYSDDSGSPPEKSRNRPAWRARP
jgi:phospholipid/cholesterol/gamma-HCH transport system substrate-binding protein